MYAKFFKRFLDFILAAVALLVLSPILLVLAVVGAIVMKGNPFFVQPRPGRKGNDGKEKIFKLIKFRTMSNAKDKDGNLLPDELRLSRYGKWMRSTSLDELPELVNIVVGDMSIVGPRPLLVEDMMFMTVEQRTRHDVTPGLTGLAQVNGRNIISWEKKLQYDLQYIRRITFWEDCSIVLKTVKSVLLREGICEENMATAENLGDYLLRIHRIEPSEYDARLQAAREMIDLVIS